MNEFRSFDIRDFIEDRLVPAKEKNKYICPNCGGHNLSINPSDGKYQCWNGCTNEEVREAIKPWSEVKAERRKDCFVKNTNMNISKASQNKVLDKESYELIAVVPKVEFPTIHASGNSRYIDFFYSGTQNIRREETKIEGVWQKNKDGFRPWHLGTKGEWIKGMGKLRWHPYKFEDVLNFGKGRWILLVEGEKSVEYARVRYGLCAFTFCGGGWGNSMQDDLEDIRGAGIAGIICWPDHDETGYKKAATCREFCDRLGIPYIQLDPLRIWDECPDKGDIADYYKAFPANKQVIIDIIDKSIRQYNEEKLDPIARAIAEVMEKDRPKVDEAIKQYKSSGDPIQQGLVKQWLMTQGYAQNIVDIILNSGNDIPRKPPTVLTGQEFNDIAFDTSGWIYPELLIDCGVQIVSGLPGAMKTTFAYSMMFAYLNGQPFLGEELSRDAQNKPKLGLIINSDQQSREMQTYTKNAPLAVKAAKEGRYHIIGGNPDEEKWTLRYLPWLEEQVDRFRYSIIVVDSYNSIHGHLPDWNENLSTAAQGINALRAIAEKYSCAIVLIHHDGKREDGSATIKTRGNTAIPGAASAVMSLTETKEDKNGNRNPLIRFLEISKLRGAACGKATIQYDPVERTFKLMPSDNGMNNRQTLNSLATSIYNSKFIESPEREYSFDELMRSFHSVTGGDRYLFLSRVLGKLEQRGVIEKVVRDNGACYRHKSLVQELALEDII